MRVPRLVYAATLAPLTLAACGSSTTASPPVTEVGAVSSAPTVGLQRVSPDQAHATLTNPPEGLVVLDVRTPDEFAEGHIDGAILLDFYEADFASQLATLDPDVSYVLYCRSGNRSGQTLEMMDALGFQNVQDVDGGAVAWSGAGLPLVAD